MSEAAVNLGVIAAFFALDVIYRQVLVRESGYLALDFSLFALLDVGFTLVSNARTHHHIGAFEASKVTVGLVFYTCLVILYTNLQRKQMHRIDAAFSRFHEFL